jgi:hypothetical protein
MEESAVKIQDLRGEPTSSQISPAAARYFIIMFVIFALGERKNDKRKKEESTTLPKAKRRPRKSCQN